MYYIVNLYLFRFAILKEKVLSSFRDSLNDILQCDTLKIFTETGSRLSKAKEVSRNSSNMWCSHRCTRDRLCNISRPCAQDSNTGSVKVNDLAKVGKASNSVVLCCGANGADA